MTEITLTPENFGKQMANLYEQVLKKQQFIISVPYNTNEQENIINFADKVNDPKNISYGPFEGEDAIDFLKSKMA